MHHQKTLDFDRIYKLTMPESEKVYPLEENLGSSCRFWNLRGRFVGCNFPRANIKGRTSCEGMVDTMCVYLRIGKRIGNISEEVLRQLKLNPPTPGQKYDIPPGDFGQGHEPDPEPIKPDILVSKV